MKIEKGIPIPESRGRTPHGTYSEIMNRMEVGDSFVVEGEKFQTIQSAVRQAARRAGIRVTTRQLTEEDPLFVADRTKIRVWRIALDPPASHCGE